MTDREAALHCLNELDPRRLSYDEWLRVGLACQHAGCSATDWDRWSAQDGERFRTGECGKKWAGFRGNGSPVTVGTLVEMVRQHGGRPPPREYDFEGEGGAFGWEDALTRKGERKAVDPAWVERADLPAPASDWAPGDLIRYLESMFQGEELVGYVTRSWQAKDGRRLPQKGVWDRTAGQLIEELQASGDLGKVMGDPDPDVGAWIRINPLDGSGCRDENVTAYRHALLEADSGDLGKQLAIIQELELPCTCIVHSGGKSIHALVKVDADNYSEYRQRVDYLFEQAKRAGLEVDGANRNPSRLSRMPGVTRDGQPQYIVSGRCGKSTWSEWVDWVEDLRDDLPDPEPLESTFHDLPDLAPALIDGVLRVGHKLLLTGPSKAGKSFALIELCAAIAEGREWMGWSCRQGPVLYVNLELDRPSCLRRFRDVYQDLEWEPANIRHIDVWNLRGSSVPLDRLAPKLIRRAHNRGYIAVVIDPIYKVLTGDENSAEEMAAFCNQFDRICGALGAAAIYSHHHSKGTQGAKRAIDRASGSGVFGRDPDAVLDFIELDLTKDRRRELESKVGCDYLARWMVGQGLDPESVDIEARSELQAFLAAIQADHPQQWDAIARAAQDAAVASGLMSGWRIEGTLREFATPPPVRIWFRYPVHRPDPWGLLADAKAAGEEPPWVEAQRAKDEARKRRQESKKDDERDALLAAVQECGGAGEALVSEVAEALGLSSKTVERRLEKYTAFRKHKGLILDEDTDSHK